jgi:uncharacterized membrane protein YkoI
MSRAAKELAVRFVVAALLAALMPSALLPAAVPARADEPGGRACLNQRERRAEVERGEVIRLAAAIRAVKGRLAGAVVRARLCRGPTGLVYVLTVLPRDGKVARLTVDAVKGTVIGGL